MSGEVTRRIAAVTAVDATTGLVTLDLFPDPGVPVLTSVGPLAVDDLVLVDQYAHSAVVVGRPVPGPSPAVDYWLIGGSTVTTTSGTNATLATASTSLLKRSGLTRVEVDLRASCFTTLATNTEATFAVGLGGTDYDIVSHFCNPVSTHLSCSGIRYLTGIAAGTYTVTIRWRRTAGTGTLTRDANDTLSLKVREVA